MSVTIERYRQIGTRPVQSCFRREVTVCRAYESGRSVVALLMRPGRHDYLPPEFRAIELIDLDVVGRSTRWTRDVHSAARDLDWWVSER